MSILHIVINFLYCTFRLALLCLVFIQYRFNATSHSNSSTRGTSSEYHTAHSIQIVNRSQKRVQVHAQFEVHTKKFLLASVCSDIDRYMKTDKLVSSNNHRTIERCAFNGILFYSRTLPQKIYLKYVV